MKRCLFVLLFATACSGIPTPNLPYDCVNPPDLAGIIQSESAIAGKYIVVMKPDARGMNISDALQSFAMENVRVFGSLSTFAATMDEATAIQLSADPRVLLVQEDGEKHTLEIWNRIRISQRNLPLGDKYEPYGTGAGVHAYIIDTGIDRNHSDFEGRMGECYSAVGGSCADDHNHGTHVAGTIASSKYGVAKAVVVHGVRVLINGSGADSDVIEGVDWAIAHVEANGWPAVFNFSIGGSPAPALDDALCRARAKGIAIAVAAGNDSGADACGYSPARVLQAATAGATERDDDVSYFSNLGQCVNVFAPGTDIVSSKRGGGSMPMNGTSMACPHVAGALALCLEAGAADPWQCVIDRASTDKLGGVGDSPNRLVFVGE